MRAYDRTVVARALCPLSLGVGTTKTAAESRMEMCDTWVVLESAADLPDESERWLCATCEASGEESDCVVCEEEESDEESDEEDEESRRRRLAPGPRLVPQEVCGRNGCTLPTPKGQPHAGLCQLPVCGRRAPTARRVFDV